MKKLIFLMAVMFSFNVFGYAIDDDGRPLIPKATEERCMAKGDVVMYTYLHRDDYTVEEMLDIARINWEDVWSKNPNIKWETYNDMQRIIRDAYRTKSDGSFVNDCCTAEIAEERTFNEMAKCIWELDY